MNTELITAVLGGGALVQVMNSVFNFVRGSKTDAADMALKAHVQLREEQKEWRDAVHADLEDMRKKLRQVEDENASLRGKVAELEARNVDLHEDNERLTKRVVQLECELDEKKSQVVPGL